MENWRKTIREMHSPLNLENKVEEAEGIIERFKNKHQKLMELNPEIGIGNIIEDEKGNPCDYWVLTVYHPFIFDVRLIPDIFENIKVESSTMGGYPNEFPSQNAELPLEDWYSPERFQKFTENNINLIRQTLKLPEMTINQALDALSGDFEKHKKWANKMRVEKTVKHKEHIDFFNKLLKKTEIEYKKSDVYREHKNENWGYSVTSSSFAKNMPVIVGFNGGVDTKWMKAGNFYGPQLSYPFEKFSGLYNDLGSLKRTIPLFRDYLPEALDGVQINYCFFRSQYEHQITHKDKELCNPLFKELVEYLEPSKLITFSRSLIDYLERNWKMLDKHPMEIQSNNKTIIALKGSILINDKKIDYYNLPHPNYPITTEVRLKAWDYCFNNE